jgi:hypothetical protein
VNFNTTGTFTVKVWYANEGPASTGQLIINGGTARELPFRKNTDAGESSVFEAIEFAGVPFGASNTMKLIGPTTGSANADEFVRIDRITLE